MSVDRKKLLEQLRHDARLRTAVNAAAKHRGVSPVAIIEELVAARSAQDVLGSSFDAYMEIGQKQAHLLDDGAKLQIVDARVKEPDDFDEMIDARNQALADAGGDELLMEGLLLQRNTQQLAATAPFTRDAPPSASKAIMGGQVIVTGTRPAQDLQPLEVAHWNSDSDEETRAIAVTVGPVGSVLPDPVWGNPSVLPYGQVLFGTRGYLIPVDFDLGRGCQFTVTASQVRLLLGLIDISNTSNPLMALTGMLSFRQTSKNVVLTKTQFITTLGAGATSTAQTVPNFAMNVTPFRDDNTQQITVNFIDSRNVIRYQVVVAAAAQNLTPIPLSGDIVKTSVTNAAGNTVNVRLVFGLSI